MSALSAGKAGEKIAALEQSRNMNEAAFGGNPHVFHLAQVSKVKATLTEEERKIIKALLKAYPLGSGGSCILIVRDLSE